MDCCFPTPQFFLFFFFASRCGEAWDLLSTSELRQGIMSPASTVFIARHGERIDHVDRTWRASAANPYDAFLTQKGLAQARALGRHLKNKDVTHIFASPFYRTVQTANQVAQELGLPMKIEPGLGEYLNEDWFDHKPKLKHLQDLKD